MIAKSQGLISYKRFLPAWEDDYIKKPSSNSHFQEKKNIYSKKDTFPSPHPQKKNDPFKKVHPFFLLLPGWSHRGGLGFG